MAAEARGEEGALAHIGRNLAVRQASVQMDDGGAGAGAGAGAGGGWIPDGVAVTDLLDRTSTLILQHLDHPSPHSA